MTEQVNPQIIIDELVKRVQSLTIENIVLSAKIQTLTDLVNTVNHSHDDEMVSVIGEPTEE
jgi:hypothetical protein